MIRKDTESLLLKGNEVVKILGFKRTSGYRYLKHLEANNILKPIRLPGLLTNRWRRDEVLELTKIRDEVNCPEFITNKK